MTFLILVVWRRHRAYKRQRKWWTACKNCFVAYDAILFVSRLIEKCFRRKFLLVFEDVWSLHTCFCTDTFRLLGRMMPANVRDVFFAPLGITLSSPWCLFLWCSFDETVDRRLMLGTIHALCSHCRRPLRRFTRVSHYLPSPPHPTTPTHYPRGYCVGMLVFTLPRAIAECTTWRQNAELIYCRFMVWSFLELPPSEWLQYKMLFPTLQATISWP